MNVFKIFPLTVASTTITMTITVTITMTMTITISPKTKQATACLFIVVSTACLVFFECFSDGTATVTTWNIDILTASIHNQKQTTRKESTTRVDN